MKIPLTLYVSQIDNLLVDSFTALALVPQYYQDYVDIQPEFIKEVLLDFTLYLQKRKNKSIAPKVKIQLNTQYCFVLYDVFTTIPISEFIDKMLIYEIRGLIDNKTPIQIAHTAQQRMNGKMQIVGEYYGQKQITN